MKEYDRKPDVAVMRRLLLNSFTDRELRQFVQEHPSFRELTADFGQGQSLNEIVDRVIGFCQTRLLEQELLEEVRRIRPGQYARFESQLWLPKPLAVTSPAWSRSGPVALRAHDGKYVCAEGGGGGAVVSDRDDIGPWETFKLTHLPDGKVALQAQNGTFLCEENRFLVANRYEIQDCTRFTVVHLGAGKVALKAWTDLYVSARGGKGVLVIADRPVAAQWETFEIGLVEDSIETEHSTVQAESTSKQDSTKDAEFRRIILDMYYEKRRDGWVSLEPADFGNRIPKSEIMRISQQLHDRGLIEFRSLTGDDQVVAGRGRITDTGVDVAEQALETGVKEGDDRSPLTISGQLREGGTLDRSQQQSANLTITWQHILLAVSRLQQSPNAFVADERIAQALHFELQQVRDHLDLMEESRLVQLAKSKAGASAMLTARGRLAIQDPSLLQGQARSGDVFYMSGNFTGSIVNIQSTLSDLRQTIQASPKVVLELRAGLARLVEQLREELEKVPPGKIEEAEAVAATAQELVENAIGDKPNKVKIQITAQGLKKAAQNLAHVAPEVMVIVERIATIISKLSGV